MLFQAVKPGRPELAVRGQPRVEIGQRLGAYPVEAALRIDARLDQSGVTQDPQVLGNRRLAEAETLHEFADRSLAVSQQLEDLEPARLGEHLERWKRLHYLSMPITLYTCQGTLDGASPS
jgi:hypothetical protein